MLFAPRLHVYTAHIRPDRADGHEEAVFVAEGFSFPAFIFAGLWALYQRLWLAALALFVMNGALMYASATQAIHPLAVSLMQLGLQLIFGFIGNDLIRRRLRKQGYVVSDIVTGDNLIRAQQRFYDRYFSRLPAGGAA